MYSRSTIRQDKLFWKMLKTDTAKSVWKFFQKLGQKIVCQKQGLGPSMISYTTNSPETCHLHVVISKHVQNSIVCLHIFNFERNVHNTNLILAQFTKNKCFWCRAYILYIHEKFEKNLLLSHILAKPKNLLKIFTANLYKNVIRLFCVENRSCDWLQLKI